MEKFVNFELPTQAKVYDPDYCKWIGAIIFEDKILYGDTASYDCLSSYYRKMEHRFPEMEKPIILLEWVGISEAIIGE